MACDDAVTHQLGQDDVAPPGRLLDVPVGGVAIGRPDETRQHGRLADGELLGFLHEVESRSLPDAEDALGAVLPEIDLVEIVLEDLVLGVHPLRHQRHERFLDLALQRAVALQEEVLHQLLGQGAAALDDAAAPQISHEGAQHRHRVHAAVIVEALVLHCQHGLPHPGGNVLQADDAALFTHAIVESGHHLRFQLDGRQDLPVVQPLYAMDNAGLQGDAYRKAVEIPQRILEVVQEHLDDRGLAVDTVFTPGPGLVPRGAIAQAPQFLAELGHRYSHSRIHDLAVRVDL